MLLARQPYLAQQVGELLTFSGTNAAQTLVRSVQAELNRFVDRPSSTGCERDDNAPPILLVPAPAYETSLLEPVDTVGHGPATEPGRVREPGCG